MSYQILLTNGTSLTTGGIPNGAVDQTATDLTLIGQNATGYGLFINENFIHLLENFANSSQPTKPITGQLWYDTSQNVLQIYNGNTFTPTGNTLVAESAPSSLSTGGIWINSKTSQLFFNDGIQTTLAGPIYTKTQGTSGFVTTDVLDAYGTNHTIVSLYVGDTLIGIFAKERFTPASSIAGYTTTAEVIATQEGTTLNVSTVISGTLSVGQTISGTGIIPGTKITGFLLGPGGAGVAQGGVGTYSLSTSATVGSTTVSAIYGEINIGFNSSTFTGIEFDVPVSQATNLLAPDGSLKSTDSFLSTTDSSATLGSIAIQNSSPLVLGTSGQTTLNVTTDTFEILSNIPNQDFQLTILDGVATYPAIFVDGTALNVGIFTDTPATTLDVEGTFRVAPATPASSSATGIAGQISWDANYIYVCTATNIWKRASLTTW